MNTLSKTELFTAANGSAASDMAMENRLGQMVLAMKASGAIIKLTAKASSIMSMVTSSMVSGAVIRLTASAPTIMLMGRNTREAGSMICRMEAERRPGKMALSTKASIVKASSMVKAATFGAMEACIWENG